MGAAAKHSGQLQAVNKGYVRQQFLLTYVWMYGGTIQYCQTGVIKGEKLVSRR